MSAAERAREWLAGMGNWNPGIIRASQGPEIVRDLLAELDQANELADTMQKWCGKARDERDAALATLREVREVADNDDLDVLPKLVRILIALDRGPR